MNNIIRNITNTTLKAPRFGLYALCFTILSSSLLSCTFAEPNPNTTLNDIEIDTLNSVDSSIVQKVDISKKYLLGKFKPANDSLYVTVPSKYCIMRTEYLHKDVLNDYISMYEAASLEGINLGIISAHRNFDVQKWLWNQRFYNSNNPVAVAKSILRYLAMPGTSRHHWGTDIDMLSTKLNYFETEIGKKSYQWLLDNAANYGFYQVYTANRETGYNEEKWHWSYMPVAKEFQNQYQEKISFADIAGFNGSETAEELNVIDDYVFGINKELLE